MCFQSPGMRQEPAACLTSGFKYRLYWLSFIPMRLVMYPVLLVRFWRVLEGYPWWDRGLVVLCQAMLCMFNYGALPPTSLYHLSCHDSCAAALMSQVLPLLCGWVRRILQARQCSLQ